MFVTYPALFYYDNPVRNIPPYSVFFPDLHNGGTQGENISDAMCMASDYLGITISSMIENHENVPEPSNIHELSLAKNYPLKDDKDSTISFDPDKSFISMVTVDVSYYLGDMKLVKKTLSIPRWADRLGKELNLNFSQTLTDAIAEKRTRV